MSGTRARKESIKVNVEYIGGKLFDSTGLSDGQGFAYDLATDKFLPIPLTATGDLFIANNLSDVADAAAALANLGGEPAIGAKGTSFNLNFGTTAGTVAEGNHNHDTVYAASGHDHSGTYEPANANIQAHISETDNPHGVTLLQLAGFPSAYVADKWMKVNATANGIEFVDAPTGGGGGTWGSITGTLADQTDLQSALEGKAASDHTHAGVYEAANANIQSHISDINKHIDWTGTNQNLSTSGYIRISVPGSAHFTLEGNTTSGKTIHFIGPGALGDICFGSNSPNMDFNVGTKRPLRLMPTGAIQMAEYGESTFAGTPTTFAGWDVDGNLIETATIPFSAISGTPTTLAGYGITDGGGGGGGGTWGSITGTLSSQTDLQSALDSKANTSHNHTGVYEPVFTKNGAFNKNFGTAASTVCQGNDSRLSDNRTPTDDSVTEAKLASSIFGTAAGLVCQGNDSRLSNTRIPTDDSVTLDKLEDELKEVVTLSASEVDWMAAIEFAKTLVATTTLTDANLVKGKVVVLHITGDFSITFPAYWDIMKGSETYDGTITNTITVHCIESASGSEEVEYYINQKEV